MRIDRCCDLAPARFDVGEKKEECREIVAFGKTLAIHETFAFEDLIRQEEAVGGDQIDLGMVRPANKQPLKDARGGALANRNAAGHADDIGDPGPLDMEKFLGGAEQLLGGRHIEVQEPRDRQIDRHDLVEIDAIIEAAKLIEIGLRQGERRVGSELRPIIARKLAVGRYLFAQAIHFRPAGDRPFRRGRWCQPAFQARS